MGRFLGCLLSVLILSVLLFAVAGSMFAVELTRADLTLPPEENCGGVGILVSAAGISEGIISPTEPLSEKEKEAILPYYYEHPFKCTLCGAPVYSESRDICVRCLFTEPVGEYDFSSPVPEALLAADQNFFEKALFIGDSRTVGLMNYNKEVVNCYADIGLSIRGVLTNPFVSDGVNEETGEEIKRTVIEMISLYPYRFDKVYIGFGLNEAGWQSSAVFINTYEFVIDEIRRILGDIPIYVQIVLPISAEVSELNLNEINNENIAENNRRIIDMCREKELYLLDMTADFTSEDGTLPAEISTDGIHLGYNSSVKYMNYIKSHIVE